MDESISTLRFGTRAKKVKNKAKVNAEKTAAEYKKELAAAKAQIKSLQRLVIVLKRDLRLACEGKLTDPSKGDGARMEAGEKIELPSDEDQIEDEKPAARDPWAVPADNNKDKEEEELIEEEEEEDDLSSRLSDTTVESENAPNKETSAETPAQVENEPSSQPKKEKKGGAPKNLSDLTMDDIETGDDNVVSIADVGGMVSKTTEQQEERQLQRSGSSKTPRKSVTVASAEIAELVSANDSLTEKIKDLRQHAAKMKTDLMMKTEALIQEKEKTENAEMDYERIQLETRSLMDESMSLKYERERLTRERDDLQAELDTNKEDLIIMKEKVRRLEQDKENEIEEIRSEERSKVDEFISQARQAIADRVPVNQSKKKPAARGNRFAGPGSQNISPDVELQQMKLDRVKLEQTLQQKVSSLYHCILIYIDIFVSLFVVTSR